jgi:O-antigen/teichoic acid export membrane protein
MLTVEEYGIVGTIINLCNFYYLFLTNGVRQSISKNISVGCYLERKVIKNGVLMQIIFSIALSLINYLIAPVLAEQFGNTEFTLYFRYVSILIPFTAIYFALTGGLNGIKLFKAEAIVTSLYPLLRLTAVPFSMLIDKNKPFGVISGFILSSFVSMLVTGILIVISFNKEKAIEAREEKPSYMSTIKTSLQFITMFAAITIVLNLDTLLLQFIKKDSVLVGYYTGVHTFSLVPYYLVSALYLVILPYIAENYQKGKIDEVKEIVIKNLRIITTFVFPIVLLISISSESLMVSFYGPEYSIAGKSLSILVLGLFMLSIFALVCVVLNGMNKKKITLISSVFIVILDIALQLLLIPKYGILGASLATSISAASGCVFIAICLFSYLNIWKTFYHAIYKTMLIIIVFSIVTFILYNSLLIDNLIVLALTYLLLAVPYMYSILKLKIINIGELTS